MIIKETTQNIEPEHCQPIEYLRKKYSHVLSSHAFASLYLWRQEMGLSLCLQPDLFSAKCRWKGENTWFFPCGGTSAKLAFLQAHEGEPDFRLCYLRQEDVYFLGEQYAGKFRVVRDDTADEYIYDRAAHMTLHGGEYANVRTQLHHIQREQELKTELLSAQNRELAIGIVRDWASMPHPSDTCGLCDDFVDEEALLMQTALHISGVLVYVDGVPFAVCAGFPLTADTFDICVAKSRENISGLSYYAKRELFSTLDERFAYINMEEDLGAPGLRQMKQILSPVHKNEIWEAMPV